MDKKISLIKHYVESHRCLVDLSDKEIMLPNDESGEGEYFQLLSIEYTDSQYICNMDCANDDIWLLEDLSEEDIDVIFDELGL